MSQKYEKLKILLKELFQLDQPDLDFGLYRVMHAKSAEVSQFLDKDLLPQVKVAFGLYQSADKAELEKELTKVIAGIGAAGMNPDDSPKVKDLRGRLKSDAVDIGALESEVYDHLFSFFRRYYSEGDFLTKRVYKPGVYAIPYEGEEVTLHWANKDQYYVKTSEYLSDYAFRLRPDDDKKPMRGHFRLVNAAEGEHGNVKAAEGKDRVFILAAPGESDHDFIAEEDGEQGKDLVIRFEYRPATLTDRAGEERDRKKKPPVQKDLSTFATKRILATTDPALTEWIAELGKPHIMVSGEQADYTRLEAHLKRYTARNTFDYFIHKDLGAFLRRELDFYIKNEVMHLDDVENESSPRVEQYLSKIKVIRKIAGKIIDFLAQLEDFQKKLWLKKKFVVETQYCITVGSIPEAFYPEIAANQAQHKEWVKLFAIDEIKGDLTTHGYSKKLKPEFLKAHPTLVVDTQHFDDGFAARLLEAIGDVGRRTDGVLFNGENFQVLSLMQARYRERVQCIYIDPPYNRDASAIDYKPTCPSRRPRLGRVALRSTSSKSRPLGQRLRNRRVQGRAEARFRGTQARTGAGHHGLSKQSVDPGDGAAGNAVCRAVDGERPRHADLRDLPEAVRPGGLLQRVEASVPLGTQPLETVPGAPLPALGTPVGRIVFAVRRNVENFRREERHDIAHDIAHDHQSHRTSRRIDQGDVPVASLDHAIQGGSDRVMGCQAFRVGSHEFAHGPVDTAAFVKAPNQQIALG